MAEKLLDSGSWIGSTTSHYQGGQSMRYQVKNINVLGTTITIDSNRDGSRSLIIPPLATIDIKFAVFGTEPIGWQFDISTDSDAFIVTWKLFSTWIPGDPTDGESQDFNAFPC